MDVLKPGDTVYIRADQRRAEVVSVDGDEVTVKPDWSLFKQTLSRYKLQTPSERSEDWGKMEVYRHQALMERTLGDGKISIADLANKLTGVSNTLSGAVNDHQTQAARKLVKVVGLMLGKFEKLQGRIDAQDKEIEQLHKFARGERRL